MMSKAREALEGLASYYDYDDYVKILEPLVDRDEPKPVLHENAMKQFGKCPVCNSSVAIQFHSDFCGKCGCRLIWRGEEK